MKNLLTSRAFILVSLCVIAVVSLFVFLFPTLPSLLKEPTPASVGALPSAPIASTTPPIPTVQLVMFQYIEVIDGCGPYYQGTCVNMRTGPGAEYAVVLRLRTGMVLKLSGQVTNDRGEVWYKVDPGTNIRYPERITADWYVFAGAVTEFNDDGDHRTKKGDTATTTKRIVVDREQEMLYAYDGDVLFMQEPISTGLESTPTDQGTFKVYAMTPSRYMQGPLPGVSDQVYDLPGVPWNLYFTTDGAVIHGAYWHDHFGEAWSHGCVNLPPEKAKELYAWAELGMIVIVRN